MYPGANIALVDEQGETALWHAEARGHAQVVAQLHGLAQRLVRDLFFAAENGFVADIERLVGLGADINQVANNGRSALMIAAKNGHTDVVVRLHELGADVNQAGNFGWTALMVAARCSTVEVVKQLHDCGADIHQVDNDGSTALMLAAENIEYFNEDDALTYLLQQGVEICARDQAGQTVLQRLTEEINNRPIRRERLTTHKALIETEQARRLSRSRVKFAGFFSAPSSSSSASSSDSVLGVRQREPEDGNEAGNKRPSRSP